MKEATVIMEITATFPMDGPFTRDRVTDEALDNLLNTDIFIYQYELLYWSLGNEV